MVGNELYFAGFDTRARLPVVGDEWNLQRHDDAHQLEPDGRRSVPLIPDGVGNTLVFAGNDGVHGYQLWSSNGTSAAR